jgi:hypothetical protein
MKQLRSFFFISLILALVPLSLVIVYGLFLLASSTVLRSDALLARYERIVESNIPDEQRCSYLRTFPYADPVDRTMFDQIYGIQGEGPTIIMLGASNAERALPYLDMTPNQETTLINAGIYAGQAPQYEAIVRYMEEEQQFFSTTESAVLFFLTPDNFSMPADQRHKKTFTRYNSYHLELRSDTEWVLTNRSPFEVASFAQAEARVDNFVNRYLQVVTPPASSEQSSSKLTDILCSEGAYSHTAIFDAADRYNFTELNHDLPNEMTEALERTTEILKAIDTPVIVVASPILSVAAQLPTYNMFYDYLQNYSAEYDVPVYDLRSLVPDVYFQDTGHYSIQGQRMILQALSEIFKQEGIDYDSFTHDSLTDIPDYYLHYGFSENEYEQFKRYQQETTTVFENAIVFNPRTSPRLATAQLQLAIGLLIDNDDAMINASYEMLLALDAMLYEGEFDMTEQQAESLARWRNDKHARHLLAANIQYLLVDTKWISWLTPENLENFRDQRQYRLINEHPIDGVGTQLYLYEVSQDFMQ